MSALFGSACGGGRAVGGAWIGATDVAMMVARRSLVTAEHGIATVEARSGGRVAGSRVAVEPRNQRGCVVGRVDERLDARSGTRVPRDANLARMASSQDRTR